MMSPKLNRKLVLEDAYHVPDDSGGFTVEWQPLGTIWAEIKSGTGRARTENGLSVSRVPLRIILRSASVGSPARPHAGQRFREGTRIYAISAVSEADPSSRYLMCQAEEEAVA